MSKIVRVTLFLLVIALFLFTLHYEPSKLPQIDLLRSYDFFALFPFLPMCLITFVLIICYLILKQKFLDATLMTGMLLQLIFIINYPNFVHHNVFSHNTATIDLIKHGNIQFISRETAKLWPGFTIAATFLELITGMDTVTLNVFMLSLFVLMIGLTAYFITKIVFHVIKNKIIMYAPIFMWILFFNNRILYEFMFHHQWYAIILFTILILVMLQLELRYEKIGRKRPTFIMIIIISAAITIIHPITGFITVAALLFYSVVRRAFLIAALTAMGIYILWGTIVSATYIGNAFRWLKVLLQGEVVSEFVSRSFQTQELLPFYDSVAKAICKTYYIIAALLAIGLFLGLLFKKVNDKKLAHMSLFLSCTLLGIIIFGLIGIASVYFEDRMYWHTPLPLAITAFVGLTLYLTFIRNKKLLVHHKKISKIIMLLATFIGLFSSSILVFGMNYYRLYYSPRSDAELSLWAIAHSSNGTKFCTGQMFRLPEYYAAFYGKSVEFTSTTYFLLPKHATSLDELIRPMLTANTILYTRHLEDSLQRGARKLGYSLNNETFKETVNSVLKACNVIYNDGLNTVYSHSYS
ncbi:MAG: hypothetical protein QXX41_01700 [Nitrososphaerota archaeon]